MSRTANYKRARRRAVAKYGARVHLMVYAAVIAFLAAIDLLTSPGVIWFIWPLLGWGGAVVIHGAVVYLASDRADYIDALTDHELRSITSGEDDRTI